MKDEWCYGVQKAETFDDMLQLADIAGPGILLHQRQNFLIDPLGVTAVFTVKFLDKEIAEFRNIIQTIPERRYGKFDGINTVVKVGTETASWINWVRFWFVLQIRRTSTLIGVIPPTRSISFS